MINTTYVTYLQSFNASPPTEKPINTLQDILHHRKKILMYEDEYKTMYEIFIQSEIYPKIIKYDEHQNFFTKRKFHLSDICFFRMLPHMIPMQANSIFEEAINEMIGITTQAGLTNHQKKLAFLEAIQRKRLNLTDTSHKDTFEPMQLEDTKWFMCLYAIMLGIASISFIFELIWYGLSIKPLIIIKQLKYCNVVKI